MLNNVCLMGRLTRNPELKHTTGGTAVCSFTIAVHRSFVVAGQERQSDFIDVVAWKKTAEFLADYFTKGQLIAVGGSLQTRSYTDKNGNKRKVVEVVANAVHFAEKKNQESRNLSGDNSDFVDVDDDFPF